MVLSNANQINKLLNFLDNTFYFFVTESIMHLRIHVDLSVFQRFFSFFFF